MEEALEIIENLIKEHETKVTVNPDITVQSQEKGYRYALYDVRDEIKSAIISKIIQG